MRVAILVTAWCLLCENAHLVYQNWVGDLIDVEAYYWITDWAMYSVKAVAFYCVASLLWDRKHGRGPAMVMYAVSVYYVIDVWNMLLWGNYDGLAPMLAGMGIAILVACATHFREKYEIVEKRERKKIGI